MTGQRCSDLRSGDLGVNEKAVRYRYVYSEAVGEWQDGR
jgi:hypothetical protein